MALPEFQRGYAWNRDQVRGLFDSLYRRHPVGSLLVWATEAKIASHRGEGDLAPGVVKLLLDGQQRMTSLYGVVRGRAPAFFDGDKRAFSGLMFHLEDELFRFYQPTKMEGDPRWVDVTALMQKRHEGLGEFVNSFAQRPELASRIGDYTSGLSRVLGILDVDLHIEELTHEQKSLDVVVDIFNRVNSGGTKLSKGDLALAKICADWPEARRQMQGHLKEWEKHEYNLTLDWLLRCVNTVLTGEAKFHHLHSEGAGDIQEGLKRAVKWVHQSLNLIGNRLGLDHDRVMFGRFAIPVMGHSPEVEENHPGALASQWIPDDPDLWKLENYRDFLEARKRLPAQAMNEFLTSLLHDDSRWMEEGGPSQAEPTKVTEAEVLGGIDSEAEEQRLQELNDWVADQGLPRGTLGYEVSDPDTGTQVAVFDLAWPEGIQEELSQPVAVLIDEVEEVLKLAAERGFRCFRDPESFKRYVTREVLAEVSW